MTLEADVADRLRRAADQLAVGEPPATAIARRARRRSRLKIAGAVVSLVGVLAVAGTVGQVVLVSEGWPHAFAPVSEGPPTRADRHAAPELRETEGVVPESGAPRAPAGQPPEFPPFETPAGPEQIGVGPKVIKTAEVSLEVRDGAFQNAFSQAQQVARRYGGFVTASATSGQAARSGQMTLRVPAAGFEAALGELHALGRVRSEQVRGEDVTAEFVDLEARLRHWLAQERVLLRLMDRATSIAETLTVQRRLEDVQLEIERIRGQLRVLRDQTSLATITVAVHEKGVAPPAPGPGTLASAWDRALAGALDVIAAIIVGLGYLLPIAVVLALIWLGVRGIRARTA